MPDPMDMKEAEKLLKTVKFVFDRLKIPFWLRCGTLLAAVRDGKFIPWDDDIDLGADTKYFKTVAMKKKVTRRLEKKGYRTLFTDYNKKIIIRRNYRAIMNICMFDLTKKDNVHLKNYDYDPLNGLGRFLYQLLIIFDTEYYGRFSNKKGMFKFNMLRFSNIIPRVIKKGIVKGIILLMKKTKACQKSYIYSTQPKYVKNLDKIKFYGDEHLIPNNVEEYLTHVYGKDWRTPNRNFEYTSTPEND
ncbi:LicD family protein [Candidatus Woesearchaeota archaeon]|nr:LicD family protein [Candidatus Woesearchaeota archaeon]